MRALALLLFASPALALNTTCSLSQLGHTMWTLQDGLLPGAPTAMAQTTDGYLWIATRSGVVRFDGVRFTPLTPQPGERLLTNRVLSLAAGSDGSLWIGTRGDLERWHEGRLTHYPQAPGAIDSIVEDRSGTVWFTRADRQDGQGPVCEVKAGQPLCHGEKDGIPVPLLRDLRLDRDGHFWSVSETTLMRWQPGSAPARTWLPPGISAGHERNALDVLQSVQPASDGSVWVAAMQPSRGLGLLRLADERLQPFVIPGLDGRQLSVSSLLLDRQGALWIGTQDEGVYRLHGDHVSHYATGDGLSSNTVQNLFEDREGTLWVLTTQGIDAFRDLRVLSFSTREGLTADLANAVLATRDGAVWINTWHSLDILRDGRITSLRSGKGLPGEEVTALLEDRSGTLWVGLDHDLTVYERGKFLPIKLPDGRSIGFIQALAQDQAGDLWAFSSDPDSLWQIHNRQVVKEVSREELSFSFGGLAPDTREGIWLGLRNGNLARYSQGHLESIDFHRAPRTGGITGLVTGGDGSVVGSTNLGLVGWSHGQQRTMTARNGLPCEDIHTLLFDHAGALWLYASCGVIFIASDQVNAWWQHSREHLEFRVFDAQDGAQPARGNLFPRGSVGPDGRIWFANASIVQMIDPTRLGVNALPPPVHIEQVVADRAILAPRAGLRLPPHTRDLQIDYTALSLVVPRKTRFRYRLEGHDTQWQDPGERRQAFYTDLPPGDYQFRVVASNNDGVWSFTGAALDFAVAPAFYQASWFAALCVIAVLGALGLLYFLRIKQIETRMRLRMEERLLERERIARDLHDTLLQSVQGLILRFQAVLTRLPEDSAPRGAMEQALQRADQVMLEGRNRVHDLRQSTQASADLPEALEALAAELAHTCDTRFTLTIEGAPRDLHPVVREEAYRIGAEALTNAFRHASASRVDTEITYSRRTLSVRIVDNGRGFDVESLQATPPRGHFGITGMRERARRIRSRLELSSRPGAGSAVLVVVPAAIAYRLDRSQDATLR